MNAKQAKKVRKLVYNKYAEEIKSKAAEQIRDDNASVAAAMLKKQAEKWIKRVMVIIGLLVLSIAGNIGLILWFL